MPDPRPDGDGAGQMARLTKDQRKRLRSVEQPSGTMLARLLETVTNRLAQIPGEVAAAIDAQSMKRQDIIDRDQAVADAAAPKTHQHAASDLTSGGTTGTGFTVGGALGVTGAMTATGAVQGQSVRATTAPSTNITGTRVAAWLQSSDGLLGTASSSERFKTNIRPAKLDPAAVLRLQVVYYQYIAELEQREEDPSYRVATEVGVIAERLHEAGLWQFVIYEREADGSLKVDDDGDPVCFGVRYELLALALIPVAQAQQKEIVELRADVAAINSKLGIA
ncbi:endosialidase-like protein [Frigoribacterium sp. PhB107]|uniref:tail fiber domain-containing protein n=1 Tax=Frigoribacterium sp. PhB107 TaxID=2485172 RepID=UPI000F47B185|nr:tail fiber domain-containing protein [Frigoribacterium sp. PhB107]ROP78334.1 endosialidase-like protein [Frigoribacterium sp. PhB107]